MILKYKMNRMIFRVTSEDEKEVGKETPQIQNIIYIAIKEIHFNWHLGYDYSKYHYYFYYQLTLSVRSLNLSW